MLRLESLYINNLHEISIYFLNYFIDLHSNFCPPLGLPFHKSSFHSSSPLLPRRCFPYQTSLFPGASSLSRIKHSFSHGGLTSFCFCLIMLLVGPLRRQPCQAPVCKHITASVIVSSLGVSHPPCQRFQEGLVTGQPFL